jgi:hypothetical protein
MAMNDSTSIEALARLAGRLESNRDFIAYVLAAYRKQERMSEEELAATFSVTPALLVRLALCRRPAEGSPDFTDRLRRIADATLIDEAQLANVLRQVEMLERLSGAPGVQEAPQHPLESLMAAARDRTPTENDEPASHEDKKGPDD